MITEALKFLADLKAEALDPKPIDIGNPIVKSYLVGNDVKTFTVEKPARRHKVFALDEIIMLAERFGGALWYNESEVSLVIDDAEHRHSTVTFSLVKSTQFLLLQALEKAGTGKRITHADFVRMLRIDLDGCVEPAVLLNRIRRMTWTNTATADRQSAKESMGRSIEAMAGTSAESVPEEVTLSVYVFDNPGERARYSIRCAVEVLPEDQSFRLLPFPGETSRVLNLAVQSFGERLAVAKANPSYFGSNS